MTLYDLCPHSPNICQLSLDSAIWAIIELKAEGQGGVVTQLTRTTLSNMSLAVFHLLDHFKQHLIDSANKQRPDANALSNDPETNPRLSRWWSTRRYTIYESRLQNR